VVGRRAAAVVDVRYATATVSVDGDGPHPTAGAIHDHPDVRLERLYYTNPVNSGGYAELLEFDGDLDAARRILRESDEVRRFELPSASTGLCYVFFEGTPQFEQVRDVMFEHAVVVKWPIEFLRGRERLTARATFVGTDGAIQAARASLPDTFEFTLERIGEFNGRLADPLTTLTDRQREVLDVAIAAGYYEVPRETTQSALADELGCAPATVADHLRRIEHNLVAALTGT